MGITRLIRQWAGSGPSTVVYECRECGTTVGRGNESCPVCGSTAISRYEIR